MPLVRSLSIVVLCATGSLTACSQSTAGLNIPARQTFLLGEYNDDAYRARLDNRGDRDVKIYLRDKVSDEVAETLTLPAGEKTALDVGADQEVAIENDNTGSAELLVKMSRGVSGMRYVNVDGSELEKRTVAPDEQRAETGAPDEWPAPSLAPGSKSTAPVPERLRVRLEQGQRLIIGEGSEGGYAVRIHTHGNDIMVSGRDADTGAQTQGFGLKGRETIYLRKGEILYLDAVRASAQVSVRIDVPVLGQRVVAIE